MGLALGLTCSLLIMAAVDEKHDHYSNADRSTRHTKEVIMTERVDACRLRKGCWQENWQRVIPEIEYTSGFEYAQLRARKNTFCRR